MKLNETKEQFWLINNGGIPMWMRGTKKGLIAAGLEVIGGPRE